MENFRTLGAVKILRNVDFSHFDPSLALVALSVRVPGCQILQMTD